MPRAHATLARLAQRVSYSHLAQAASPDNRSVDAALLEAAIDEDDLSSYSAELQAAAQVAVDRIQLKVDDANTEVDSYLTRYPNLTATDDLAVYAVDIALYRIFGGDRESERYVRYQSALQYLRDVASGKINLDLDDSETDGTGSGRARFSGAKPQFRRDELARTL